MPTSPALLPPGRKRRSAPTAAQALANARKATKGVKVGRPRTYCPEMCDEAIALGHKGKSWAAIAREFGVDRGTLNKWATDFPEFSSALARARAASQAWWEDDIQRRRGAKHYQANAVRLLMSAQFQEDYADRRNVAAGLELLPDLLGAIDEVAKRRAAALPGDGAKPVTPQDVVLDGQSSTPDKA